MGRTQVGFASEVGVTERTVHYWTSKGPPAEICYLVDVLTTVEMPFGPNIDLVDDPCAAAAFARATTQIMDQLADRAAHRGAKREFIDAVRLWIDRETNGAAAGIAD
ncbi:UNVERIFIED_ORG: hypothetical protein M2438_000418 [Methylobacterium sp. SuP10 SLI 274]|uniref:hypothetical protein n=1 Tax=Methylorubrum extorquens TaxID=408 RepID=UPI00209DA1FC|nr:hypothetical protein [Methylorubrum extorquens]MDF9861616.1 hypothetical protein [Methylorubrum pseudosasae]MDH6635243.1 hypothetical protein [Methylobacterium sp. SuP10 SLI 274]MDH6664412.1 hypothetical protein [Methylorubrum zatmanii]MCP1561414.1 hypothetical protein [Methylorubrum extorquens]MDF9789909.1 hypothetical protein [Methylorubrum extorquens]